MANHTVDCEHCGEDLRSKDHAPECVTKQRFQMDRDELKIKVRDAIWTLDSQALQTGHWEDPLTYAEAALSAIEEAGYVIMPEAPSGGVLIGKSLHHLNDDDLCQARSSTQGETVSASPPQADIIADAALMKALGSVAWLADQEYRNDHSDSTMIATGLLRELRDGYQRIAERRNKPDAAASAVWDEAVEACITECFHQEQLHVWSDEFLSDLAAIGHVNPDTSYDDVVDMHRRFQEFLKHTVVSRICSLKRSPSEETDV